MEYVEPGESYQLEGDGYSIRVVPMGQKSRREYFY